MAVVAMPNGDHVSFPDNMPPSAIKALIASKFPDAVSHLATPVPGFVPGHAPTPEQVQAFEANRGKTNNGQMPPEVGDNPAGASPSEMPDIVPAPIRAFSENAVNAVPVIGPGLHALRGAVMGPEGAAQMDALGAQASTEAPVAAGAGTVFGTVAPFVAGGAIPAVAKGLGMAGNLGTRVVMGGLSGAGIGGADTLARGGSPTDALINAGIDGTFGAVLPAAGAGVKRVLGLGAKAPAVDIGALEAAKNAAYTTADQLGVRYSPSGYDGLVNKLVTDAKAGNINPNIHPASTATLTQMAQAPAGYSPTLTQLDQLRQQVSRDVMSKDPGERHFGMQMINGIDDFINNASNAQVANGSGPAAAQAITDARGANSVLRKTQTVQAIIDNAALNAASANSGGNINNNLRQGFKTLLKADDRGVSQAQKQGFTPGEIAQMQVLVRGGTQENAMRYLGNIMKPGPISAVPWGMAISHMPALAAVPVAGQVFKRVADTGTVNKAQRLAAMVAGLPMPQPQTALMAPAAMPLLENRVQSQVMSPWATAVGQ